MKNKKTRFYLGLNDFFALKCQRWETKAVTPGQACVLYLGEECLGCGFIKNVKNEGTNLWYLQN